MPTVRRAAQEEVARHGLLSPTSSLLAGIQDGNAFVAGPNDLQDAMQDDVTGPSAEAQADADSSLTFARLARSQSGGSDAEDAHVGRYLNPNGGYQEQGDEPDGELMSPLTAAMQAYGSTSSASKAAWSQAKAPKWEAVSGQPSSSRLALKQGHVGKQAASDESSSTAEHRFDVRHVDEASSAVAS